jgi:predicted CoA-binding protein
MTIREQIDLFLSAPAFAVIGASADRNKFGNKVVRCYLMHNKRIIPVNPKESTIEGISCVASVTELPPDVTSISIITPPAVTEQVVAAAIAKGIMNIWMQPGAESPLAIQQCREAGVNVIADGSCILVVLGYHEH